MVCWVASGEDIGTVKIHRDPQIEEWDPEVKIFRTYQDDKYIDIDGSSMSHGAAMGDYVITVGKDTGNCRVVQLFSNKITCQPPSKEPRHGSLSKDDAPSVQLTVGFLRYHVGHLDYYTSPWDEPPFRAGMISLFVILGVIVLVVVAYCVARRLYGDPIQNLRRRLRYKVPNQDANSYEERPKNLMDILDPDLKAKILECLIEDPNRMRLGNEIGKGNFGKVYSGLLLFPGDEKPTDCAVKTLKCEYQPYLICSKRNSTHTTT